MNAVAVVLIALSCAPACATELTADEARTLIERTCGVDLAAVEPTISVWGGQTSGAGSPLPGGKVTEGYRGRSLQVATFTSTGERAYEVDLSNGQLIGWQSPPPPAGAEPRLTQEQALDVAKAAAVRVLGADADFLEWQESPAQSSLPIVEWRGAGRRAGDPPRTGLAPSCSVTVSLVDGTVVFYNQTIPDSREPLPVTVTAPGALSIARDYASKQLGWEDVALECEPSLTQWQDRVLWHVAILRGDAKGASTEAADGDSRQLTIDAATGAVLVVGEVEGATGRDYVPAAPAATQPTSAPAASPPAPASTRQGPWPYLAGAGALALLAGVVIVARRKRK
jgi:hypothetical protein